MTGNRPEGKGWMERWYRVMLLGYPRRYRERHGGELLGTLLEAHPARRLPSPRESVSLLDTGVLTRLRTRLDKIPAWADGLQLGLFLLALTQAGSLLGHLSTAHQRPQLPILLPLLLVAVAILLGRMGTAAMVASIPAVAATCQALLAPGHGTDHLAGIFSSRTVEVSSAVNFWLSQGPSQFWLIAAGSAVLAVHRRTRGPLPRRSWWWLMVPLSQAAFTSYSMALLPAANPPDEQAVVVPASGVALSLLPLIATIGFLLLALRATVAIGDPRWAIAAGVYLIPIGVHAAALVSARPSALVTLDYQLPAVLLTAASAAVLLRRTRRRAQD